LKVQGYGLLKHSHNTADTYVLHQAILSLASAMEEFLTILISSSLNSGSFTLAADQILEQV
jgi:hypothetical protein